MTHGALRLGIDLGTSAVKAVALDASGRVVATGEASYPTHADEPGQAEQEPSDWLQAASVAAGSIGGQLGPGWPKQLQAIGLTGQLPTLVCLGDHAVLGRATTWTDSRADDWAGTRVDAERRRQFYRLTGMPIDGRYLAPMFQFHWPERRAGVRKILSAKDFLCFALTGRTVTDPSTAAGYGVYNLAEAAWDGDLCNFWNLDEKLLPGVAAADDVAGGLTAAGARLLGLPEGLPVMTGAADSVCGALAMSGASDDTVSIVMGSSTIVIAATEARLLDAEARYLLTPHARAGWYGREMDLLATGTGYHWLCRVLGWNSEQFETRALRSPPGAGGVFFSPYLAGGEQGALWNPALRGVIHGLTVQHDPADIARAHFEGVFFEIRRCIDVLEETAGAAPIRRVVLSGHMVANRAIVAMLADALGRPVQIFSERSPSAIGAALLGADFDQEHRPLLSDPIEPGPAASAYDGFYSRYRALFPAIAAAPSNG
ncbi:MAG: FGGY-family carbohydrate kinase [Parvibaculaceae bacterium]